MQQPLVSLQESTARSVLGLAILLGVIVAAPSTVSAQWPQYGGPNRNFTSPSTGLSTTWPGSGPKKLWERSLGDGYSGMAVVDSTIYTMYRKGGQREVVVALDAETGKDQWEHAYSAEIFEGLDRGFGVGPRATPLVVGDRLFTVGISAVLHALDRRSGSVLWSHDFMKDYNVTPPRWGYSSSPMAYQDMVILPGGGKGHGVMAFNQADGKLVWSRQDYDNAYSSPMLIHVDGQDQLVLFAAAGVFGLDPSTGDQLWRFQHKTDYDVNATQPLWDAETKQLFITSDYGTGSRMIQLSREEGKTKAKEVWRQKKMHVHFGSVIRVGDLIYGSSGGNGPALFSALEARTGKMAFQQRDTVAKAQLLYADGKLVILDEEGQLAIAAPTPTGITVLAKAQLLSRVAWTVPTLVGKRLYIRDLKKIMALDLE